MSPKLWCVWGGRSDGGVRALGDGHGLRAQSPDSEAEREPHGRYPASMAEGTPPREMESLLGPGSKQVGDPKSQADMYQLFLV